MATVTEDCTVNYGGQTLSLREGQKVSGGLERYLQSTGAPVGSGPPVGGTIDEMWDWIGDDPDRVARALEAEQANKNRSTLVDDLRDMSGEG